MRDLITLTQRDLDDMVAHAKNCLPEEACGLVAGEKNGGDKIIRRVYYLTNTDHSGEHFSLDPREQLSAVKDMRANGFELLGNWHSHPQSPSRPSEEDKRLAFDNTASYLILSLMEADHPVIRSFHIERNVSRAEELIIQGVDKESCQSRESRR